MCTRTTFVLVTLLLLSFVSLTLYSHVSQADQRLVSYKGQVVQSKVHSKALQQAPFALAAASKVIRIRGTLNAGELDFRGAMAVIIRPLSGNLTAWWDSDTTKTWTVEGAVETTIFFDMNDTSLATLTINGTDTSIEVGGF